MVGTEFLTAEISTGEPLRCYQQLRLPGRTSSRGSTGIKVATISMLVVGQKQAQFCKLNCTQRVPQRCRPGLRRINVYVNSTNLFLLLSHSTPNSGHESGSVTGNSKEV
jgi:hypothetical protein